MRMTKRTLFLTMALLLLTCFAGCSNPDTSSTSSSSWNSALSATPTKGASHAVAQATLVPTHTTVKPTPTMAHPTPTPTKVVHQPTPTPIPRPTQPPVPPAPTPTPKPACVGVNGNPWCYDFNPGNLIYHPNPAFCSYFLCVSTFWTATNGYVAECVSGKYTHSDGVSGACSRNGGVLRPLFSH